MLSDIKCYTEASECREQSPKETRGSGNLYDAESNR